MAVSQFIAIVETDARFHGERVRSARAATRQGAER
jgi:hypothetical protein